MNFDALLVSHGVAPAAAPSITLALTSLSVADRDASHVDAILSPYVTDSARRASVVAAILAQLLAPAAASQQTLLSLQVPVLIPQLQATVSFAGQNPPGTTTLQQAPTTTVKPGTTTRSAYYPWVLGFLVILSAGAVTLGILALCGAFSSDEFSAGKQEIQKTVTDGNEVLGHKIDALGTQLTNTTTSLGTKVDTAATSTEGKIDALGTQLTNTTTSLGTKVDTVQQDVGEIKANARTSLNVLLAATATPVNQDGSLGTTPALATQATQAAEARATRQAIAAARRANAQALAALPQPAAQQLVDLSGLATRQDVDASNQAVLQAIAGAKARVVVTP